LAFMTAPVSLHGATLVRTRWHGKPHGETGDRPVSACPAERPPRADLPLNDGYAEPNRATCKTAWGRELQFAAYESSR
jgi:hypothetical protein